MGSQILLGIITSPLDSVLFALLVSSYVVPIALIALLLWWRTDWRPVLPTWRWCLWNGGLALGTLAAIAMPSFLLGLQFLSTSAKNRWFIDAGSKSIFYALLIAPIAIVLFSFGGGKQRWIGILSAAFSFVVLYLGCLATSY
jgi:hypothetical protein